MTDQSWVRTAENSDFPIQNLPLGIFSEAKGRRRPGVAIGDYVLDLAAIADLLDEDWREDLAQPVLNAWLARGHRANADLRERLSELLSDERYRDDVEPQLIGQSITRPTSESNSAPIIRCCPTTNMCRSGTTGERARCALRVSR